MRLCNNCLRRDAVGDAEGDAVGDAEGAPVGDAVGDAEGLLLGLPVGGAVGDALGDTVGATLGIAVGARGSRDTDPNGHCTGRGDPAVQKLPPGHVSLTAVVLQKNRAGQMPGLAEFGGQYSAPTLAARSVTVSVASSLAASHDSICVALRSQ